LYVAISRFASLFFLGCKSQGSALKVNTLPALISHFLKNASGVFIKEP